MIGPDLLANQLAYNAQMLAIVATSAVVLRVLALPSPGARYAAWRLALAVCLVTPWLLLSTPPQIQVTHAIGDLADTPVLEPAQMATDAPVVSESSAHLPWSTVLEAIALTGIGLRTLWLAIGLSRLSALRRRSTSIDDAGYARLQRGLGVSAEIASVPGLLQPVTFGVRRPIVLIPESLTAAPEGQREAVITHELLHVRRRDWCWLMAEELLRTAMWFQPAVWWATSRIQRSREEVVDELTVLATGNRRGYIEALLAFADAGHARPAAAFARRAHLFARIVRLSEESVMSSYRAVISGAGVVITLTVAAWSASALFPVFSPVLSSAMPVLEASTPAAVIAVAPVLP